MNLRQWLYVTLVGLRGQRQGLTMSVSSNKIGMESLVTRRSNCWSNCLPIAGSLCRTMMILAGCSTAKD